jgi:hypothetical protein
MSLVFLNVMPQHSPNCYMYTDKKENKTFLIYKEIHMGSGAKSNMRKDFIIHEEMSNIFPQI